MLAFAFSLSNQPFEIGLFTFPFIVKLLFSDFTLLVSFNGHKENQILNTLDRRLPLAWKRSDKTDFKLSGNFEVIPEHGLILSCNKSWISWF